MSEGGLWQLAEKASPPSEQVGVFLGGWAHRIICIFAVSLSTLNLWRTLGSAHNILFWQKLICYTCTGALLSSDLKQGKNDESEKHLKIEVM